MALRNNLRHLRETGMDDAPDQAPERYVRLPVRVLRQMGLSHGAIVLYGILLDYAGTKKICWPAADTLAADLGVHRNTVHMHTRKLEQAGLIAVKRHGKGKGNTYALLSATDGASHHAQPTVHDEEEHAQPSVHERHHAQPTVHGHAQPTVHPIKEEQTPIEQTPETTSVVSSMPPAQAPIAAENEPTDEQRRQARGICGIIGIPLDAKGTAERSMVNLLSEYGAKCSRPVEDLAVDCAHWCESKRVTKRTVMRFRNWLDIHVNGWKNERGADHGGYRGCSQTDASTRQAAALRQDRTTRERLFKLLDRGGDVAEFYGLARDDPWPDGAAELYDLWRKGHHRAGRGGGDGPVLPAQL